MTYLTSLKYMACALSWAGLFSAAQAQTTVETLDAGQGDPVDISSQVKSQTDRPSGAFSKIANRDCKLWNPNPGPNETVYWTGKCVDGLAEGKGTIGWGSIQDGQAAISLSDITLKGGKAIGLGTYFSKSGDAAIRQYIDGATEGSLPIDLNKFGASAEQDYFASTYLGGLVGHTDWKFMADILTYSGMEVLNAQNVFEKSIKFKSGDMEMSAAGAACEDAGKCRMLVMNAVIETPEPLDLAAINQFNWDNGYGTLVRSPESETQIVLSKSLILYQGRTPENIKVNIQNFASLAQRINTEFAASNQTLE